MPPGTAPGGGGIVLETVQPDTPLETGECGPGLGGGLLGGARTSWVEWAHLRRVGLNSGKIV